MEKEEDITLEFAKNDYQITGKWYAGSHLRLQFKAEKNDKCWKVTEQQGDSALMAKEVLKSLVCSAGFNQMRGNITVYSQSAKEPLKPSCFILDKVNPGTNDEAPIIINHYYPNPVDNLLHIDFTVNRADNVTFQISDIMGRPCFTTEKKAYDPGYYSVTLRPTLATGNYTLVVVDDHGRWARKIIKK